MDEQWLRWRELLLTVAESSRSCLTRIRMGQRSGLELMSLGRANGSSGTGNRWKQFVFDWMQTAHTENWLIYSLWSANWTPYLPLSVQWPWTIWVSLRRPCWLRMHGHTLPEVENLQRTRCFILSRAARIRHCGGSQVVRLQRWNLAHPLILRCSFRCKVQKCEKSDVKYKFQNVCDFACSFAFPGDKIKRRSAVRNKEVKKWLTLPHSPRGIAGAGVGKSRSIVPCLNGQLSLVEDEHISLIMNSTVIHLQYIHPFYSLISVQLTSRIPDRIQPLPCLWLHCRLCSRAGSRIWADCTSCLSKRPIPIRRVRSRLQTIIFETIFCI